MNNFVAEKGSIVGSLVCFFLFIFLLGIFLIFLTYFVFGKVIPPNFIGVRRYSSSFFGRTTPGFSDQGLPPGLHWQIPAIGPLKLIASEVILLPRDLQFVHLHAGEQEGGSALVRPSLNVQTSVGAKVQTDVTFIYRFFDRPLETTPEKNDQEIKQSQNSSSEKVPLPSEAPRSHGGPKNLLETFGATLEIQLRQFTDLASKLLRDQLKELSTTDYYDPVFREKAVVTAHEQINELGNKSGIELWGVLLRRYVYADKKIDDQIFAKNLQDQAERFNSAASELAAVQAKTERERALWDAKVGNLEVEGEGKVRVLHSEGELYEAKKVAEGDYLVTEAKAKVDYQKATALHELNGADFYIAKEMAPLLGTLRGGIVTDIDPYDVTQWIGKLSGKGNNEERATGRK